MKTFVKCQLCDIEIDEECKFAVYKKVIDGQDYIFCCKRLADEYQVHSTVDHKHD
jgi:hypothetical protein